MRSGTGGGSYRLRLILKDLPGLLLVAQLLDALSLKVAFLALLKQGVGSPVPDQELGGCVLAQNWGIHTHALIYIYIELSRIYIAIDIFFLRRGGCVRKTSLTVTTS